MEGKGQLSAAVKALNKLGLYGKIPIIGIAKEDWKRFIFLKTLIRYISVKKSESCISLDKV